MNTSTPFPTLCAAGFSAYIDLIAYEPTDWTALIHALSLFGHKTAVDAIRARLRMGESVSLSVPHDLTARLVLPEAFLTRTRRAGELTHATLWRDPATLTPNNFLVLAREGEDPAQRFHRMCDVQVTTPLLPEWAPWLWRWAQQSGTVRPLCTIECEAWTACVDEMQLEQALAQALQTGTITILSPASGQA
jgi:hypothetical protein